MEIMPPKIILEGIDLAGTKRIALALSKHPRIVGKGAYKQFSVVISAKWCSFTKFPWGEHLIDFGPEDEAQAMKNYQTWMALIERQEKVGWIVDRFHLSTMAYQLLTYQKQVHFEHLESRLAAAGFRQFLLLCPAEDFGKLVSAGNSPPVETDADQLSQAQDLLRRLAAKSALPTQEITVVRNDLDAVVEQIADWLEVN